MQKITKEEMKKVDGGGGISATTVVILITGLISFVTGIFHGYANPKKCNN